MQALSLRQGIVHAYKHIRASLHAKKVRRASARRAQQQKEKGPLTWWLSEQVGETIILRPYGLPWRPDGRPALGLTCADLVDFSTQLGGRRVLIVMDGTRSAFLHPRPALY